MVENLKMKALKIFVKSMEFSTVFQLQELHIKMGLWRGKTWSWKRLLEPY